jgi:hydroxymethylbilane synthase
LSAELVRISTLGDRTQAAGTPLHAIGGQGVFVKEVQHAVLGGRADLAVHSAKDLPARTADGLVLAAVPERGEVCDALVGSTLSGLRSGAVIATGSVRRRAQLSHLRPDLHFVELRGNMHARVSRVEPGHDRPVDAVVVAAVALVRLGLGDRISERFDPTVVVPQVAQGALAIECRAEDGLLRTALALLEDWRSRLCVDAERAFLATVGGACDLPVGAWARPVADGWQFTGVLAAADGTLVREERFVAAPGGLAAAAVDAAADAARRVERHGGRA